MGMMGQSHCWPSESCTSSYSYVYSLLLFTFYPAAAFGYPAAVMTI